MKKINIAGKDYSVKPGYGALYLFCIHKNIEFSEFMDRVSGYKFDSINNDFLDDLAEYTLCFIERGGDECHLSKLDVIDWIGEGNAETIFKLLTDSIGVSKNQVAPAKKGA